RPPLISTPFPYTTLFRSRDRIERAPHVGVLVFESMSEGLAEIRHCKHHDPYAVYREDLVHLAYRRSRFDVRHEHGDVAAFLVHRSEEHTSELQSPYDLVC